MTDQIQDYDMRIREQMKEAARNAAWQESLPCPECGGGGRVPGNQWRIHSRSLRGVGADWNLEGVLQAIDAAEAVVWVRDSLDHNLRVLVDGRGYGFEVPIPDGVVPVMSANESL